MSQKLKENVLTLQDFLDAQGLQPEEIGVAKFNQLKGTLQIYDLKQRKESEENKSDARPAHK